MKELASIERLIDSLSLFPTIGTKSAERMAYALLEMKDEDIDRLIENITAVKNNIHQCPECGCLTDKELCEVCSNIERDRSTCIVVAYPKDVFTFEKVGNFNGVYHVLNGLINLSKNITPDNLEIESLKKRIQSYPIKELIIATPGTPDGEVTAFYISKVFKDLDVNITRLGYGIPIGSNLEYVDTLTIERAIKNRTKIEN